MTSLFSRLQKLNRWMVKRSVTRDIWRQILVYGWRDPRSAWSNVRFMVGLWIGGFSKAERQRRGKDVIFDIPPDPPSPETPLEEMTP